MCTQHRRACSGLSRVTLGPQSGGWSRTRVRIIGRRYRAPRPRPCDACDDRLRVALCDRAAVAGSISCCARRRTRSVALCRCVRGVHWRQHLVHECVVVHVQRLLSMPSCLDRSSWRSRTRRVGDCRGRSQPVAASGPQSRLCHCHVRHGCACPRGRSILECAGPVTPRPYRRGSQLSVPSAEMPTGLRDAGLGSDFGASSWARSR